MGIRGTVTQRICSWVRPAAARPASFAQKFDRTKTLLRDGKSALWRMPLYSLSFFSLAGVLPFAFGLYAVARLFNLEKGDPRGWRKPIYAAMAINGVVPLAQLSYEYIQKLSVFGSPETNPVAPLQEFALFFTLPLFLVGVGRYVQSLVISGRMAHQLAAAALTEDSQTVADTFGSAQKRLDRKVVFKTMRDLQAADAAKFLEIVDLMQRAQVNPTLLAKLQGLAGRKDGL